MLLRKLARPGRGSVAAFGAVVALVGPLALSGSTFARRQSSPPQLNLSRAPEAQTEASTAIDPTNSSNLLAASQNGFRCALRVYSSTDRGRSWSSKLLPSPDAEATQQDPGWRRHVCAGNQWVGIDGAGTQYLAFVAGDVALSSRGWTVFVAARDGAGASWNEPVRVDGASAGKDDKPMLVADTSPRSPHRGRIYLAWTRWPDSSTRDVLIAFSDDRGRTWSEPHQIGEGWGAHLSLANDGTLYAAWWGSNGTLEIARSSNGSELFSPTRAFASLRLYAGFGLGFVPAMRREAVHPDPSVDVDRTSGRYGGRIYAVGSLPSNRGRQVYLTALNGKLEELFRRRVAPPSRKTIRDAFNATVAVDQSNGTIWLCFYLTGSGRHRILASYSCSNSNDGGRDWSKPRAVASVPSNEAQTGGFRTVSGVDSEYASYEGLAVSRGTAYPVWTDTRKLKRLKEEIYATRVRTSR